MCVSSFFLSSYLRHELTVPPYRILSDHENMVGLKKVEAGDDLVPVKKRRSKAKVKIEEEPWGGIAAA